MNFSTMKRVLHSILKKINYNSLKRFVMEIFKSFIDFYTQLWSILLYHIRFKVQRFHNS